MVAQSTFEISHLLRCGTSLRTIGADAVNMEEVASAVVGYLRGHFIDKETGESALPLVRFFVLQRSDELEPVLQDFARAAGPDAPLGHEVPCLTLLATAGEEPAWNDRRASVSHKAIPLPSVAALERSPMIAQLLEQLGLDARHIIEPDPAVFQDLEAHAYDVFFVAEARDSPIVPAQEGFVIPYGIRSVVAFGGVLPDGALFAVVVFSRVPIPLTSVDAFAPLALSVKIAVLPHVGGEIFAGQPPPSRSPEARAALDRMLLESANTTLVQLLDIRASVVEDQALRLERQLTEAVEQASELASSRAALASSEARKTAIVEGAPDCVVGMDSHGRIIDFNQAAESTFGYAAMRSSVRFSARH